MGAYFVVVPPSPRIPRFVPGPLPDTGHGVDDLARLLDGRRTLVLTGAGISTDSGIPDYRGPGGDRRVDPILFQEFRRDSSTRARYWARAFAGWLRFAGARPNPAHHALAALQSRGRVGTVITQNVDGLHQAAGTRDVIELHGTLERVVCLTCGQRVRRAAVNDAIAEGNPGFAREAAGWAADRRVRPDGDVDLPARALAGFRAPTCPACGDDTLKPDVVFFGDSVPPERVTACVEALDRAEALLVLGSSLAVYSGFRFVRAAAEAGKPVAIVTRGGTRGDHLADVRLDAGLADAVPGLAVALG